METTFYLSQTVSIPMPLYRSMKGRYFAGCADLEFTGAENSAWASLMNPADSGANLHVDIWSVTSLSGALFAHVWLNASMPGDAALSQSVAASNFALFPPPRPSVRLLKASNAEVEPQGGVKALILRCHALSSVEYREDGKYIFPPGGSFSVLLSGPDAPEEKVSASVSFCWWEEPLAKMSVYGSHSQRSHAFKGGERAKPPSGGE